MDIRLIRSPSNGCLKILEKRTNFKFHDYKPGGIGLVQGKIIEMIEAADIAEKTSNVEILDVRGSCPQNFVMLAIIGEISAVEEALNRILLNKKRKIT